MIAVVVACTGLLGWAVRRTRGGGRRSPVGPPRPDAWVHTCRTVVRRWSGRFRPERRGADPAPLLQFRTAIERGASVLQALEAVAAGAGPWADGASRVVRQVGAGSGLQPAVDTWVAESGDPTVRLFADALAISTGTGGSHVRAVDAVIAAVRERAALQREVRALVAQAQTSAIVLVLLPVSFALAVALVDPRVRGFYVGSALGPLCVAAGLLLDGFGAWLMLRMVWSVA